MQQEHPDIAPHDPPDNDRPTWDDSPSVTTSSDAWGQPVKTGAGWEPDAWPTPTQQTTALPEPQASTTGWPVHTSAQKGKAVDTRPKPAQSTTQTSTVSSETPSTVWPHESASSYDPDPWTGGVDITQNGIDNSNRATAPSRQSIDGSERSVRTTIGEKEDDNRYRPSDVDSSVGQESGSHRGAPLGNTKVVETIAQPEVPSTGGSLPTPPQEDLPTPLASAGNGHSAKPSLERNQQAPNSKKENAKTAKEFALLQRKADTILGKLGPMARLMEDATGAKNGFTNGKEEGIREVMEAWKTLPPLAFQQKYNKYI